MRFITVLIHTTLNFFRAMDVVERDINKLRVDGLQILETHANLVKRMALFCSEVPLDQPRKVQDNCFDVVKSVFLGYPQTREISEKENDKFHACLMPCGACDNPRVIEKVFIPLLGIRHLADPEAKIRALWDFDPEDHIDETSWANIPATQHLKDACDALYAQTENTHNIEKIYVNDNTPEFKEYDAALNDALEQWLGV